jgi:hypothetical protein
MAHLQKLAKSYDFESEYEFFDYIIDSYYNGHRSQVRELYQEIRYNDDKAQFVDYLHEMATDEVRDEILNIIGLNR